MFTTTLVIDKISRRYLMVGVANTLVGLSMFPTLYFFLHEFLDSTFPILVLSYVFSTLFSFRTQQKLVFAISNRPGVRLARFVTLNLIALSINALLLPFVQQVSDLHVVISQLIAIVPIIIGSYFGSRFWVFSER